jgi:hypothetical protein
MLRQLASCSWVSEHLNVLVTGGTGVGKSYPRLRARADRVP